jgi:membrane-bound ClpP family serine protease
MHPIIVAVLLLLAGFACMFLELLIPSAGLIALISGALLVSGVVVGFTAGMIPGLVILVITLTAIPVVISFLIQIWPKTPIGRRVFIPLPKREDVEPDPSVIEALESLVGKNGIARSKLLPSGSVTIDGKHYDAVSDGLPIEKNQKITVVAIKAQRIFVRPQMLPNVPENEDALSQTIDSLGLESIEDPLES